MPCCPRSVDATWRRTNLRSSLPSSIARQSSAVCACFAVLPSNFKRPYLFKRLADLGEFYVKSKGFPCSTRKSSDLEEWTKKEGPFFLMWGLFRAKNTRMALLVTWGTGLRRERGSYAMLSSFGRCYMGKNESPFKFTSSIAQAKSAVCACFSLFCPPTSKGHIFSTARPIWVNFMSNQRVFRALRRNRAIWKNGRKKEGPFFLMWGLSGLKIPEWHCS